MRWVECRYSCFQFEWTWSVRYWEVVWSQRKVGAEDEGEGVGEDEDEIQLQIETMTDMAIEDVRHRACLVGRLQEQQIRF